MIFIGDRFEFEFRTKTKTSVRCALGRRFYVLLFSDNSAVYRNKTHHICFVVPVHYPSFVRSVSKVTSTADSIDMLFEFENPEDRRKLSEYVRNIDNHAFEIIKDLEFIRKNKK